MTSSVFQAVREKRLIYNYIPQCAMKLLLWNAFLKMLSNNYFNFFPANCCIRVVIEEDGHGGKLSVCAARTTVHADEPRRLSLSPPPALFQGMMQWQIK